MYISEFYKADNYNHIAVLAAALHHDGFWGTMPVKTIPERDIANMRVRLDISTGTLLVEGITGCDEANGKWHIANLAPITTEYRLCVHEGILTGEFKVRAVRYGPTYDTFILIIRPS